MAFLFSRAARTLRTVRHLRPAQVVHRLRYRWRRMRWEARSPAVDARYRQRAAGLPPARWDHPGLARVADWRLGGRQAAASLQTARDALEGRFDFLGRSETFGSEVDWFRPDLDAGTRLWKTQLHEFSYAVDLARAAAETGEAAYRSRLFGLARSWRGAAPIGCRDFALDAWNARAVATRLVNWAVAGRLLGLGAGDAEADWLGREIAVHGLFLRDNLELDLRGNHLFRDAVGLVFADELVGGVPDALDWLERQVAEQILPDGCHVERTPFYHLLCAQDLLEVRLLLGDRTPDWLDAALGRMAGWLEAICLGDGEIPLLGDGWLGELSAPRLLEAARRCTAPLAPVAPERHGGLAPLAAGPWRLVLRAGPHGPDEQLGHAHADLLAFDASHGPHRVVTDTGTLLYDPGPDRDRLRSTAAHNTLRLDAQEQLEAWGSFRVGRRGRAQPSCRGRSGTWEWLAASHDAYYWLPGNPVHHRLVALGAGGILVLDAVLGAGRHHIESHLHQHPDGEALGVRVIALPGPAARESAPLHEHFGETRSMIRHRIVSHSRLPWLGGWWITAAGGAGAEAPVWLGNEVQLGFGEPEVRLSWRPHSTDAQAVRLCSASGGSAT